MSLFTASLADEEPVVPEAAAPTPPRASFAGTWIFNFIAIACVAGITAFVVFSPLGGLSGSGLDQATQRAQALLTGRARAGSHADAAGGGSGDEAADAPAAAAPSTIAASTSTSTTTSSTTTTSTAPTDRAANGAAHVVYLPAPTTAPATTTSPGTTTTTTVKVLRCKDFVTQPEAQALFDQDSLTYAGWDGDGDGVACEDLPGRPAPSTTAPATTVPVLRCKDFVTQPEAQAVFDEDPATYATWDGDGDGLACEELHGGPGSIPSVQDVIKPPAVRYYGAHTRQAPSWMGDLDAMATAVGKTPNMTMFFTDLAHPFPDAEVDLLWDRGMAPMITLEAIVENSGGAQPTLDELASPAWDEYFTQWATAARDNGKPVVLRFGHEMNGDWYSWAERYKTGGATLVNQPGDFVATWRHIHDIFTSVGADNVIFYWSVNRINQLPAAGKDINSFYPGDAYVDWIGMSGYCRLAVSGQPATCDGTFDTTFKQTLDALQTMAGRRQYKPVVIGETAAAEGDPLRTTWTQNFFTGLKARPEVIGFVWFNDVKPNTGHDWRIQYSAEQTAAFAAGVADARYGQGKPPAG